MTAQQDFLGFIDTGGQISGPAVVGMPFLDKGAVRKHNVLAARALAKTQDFVGLILGHRSRTGADFAVAPRVRLALSCRTPAGKAAVEISL